MSIEASKPFSMISRRQIPEEKNGHSLRIAVEARKLALQIPLMYFLNLLKYCISLEDKRTLFL
jgi:hypothetical protein